MVLLMGRPVTGERYWYVHFTLTVGINQVTVLIGNWKNTENLPNPLLGHYSHGEKNCTRCAPFWRVPQERELNKHLGIIKTQLQNLAQPAAQDLWVLYLIVTTYLT